MPFLSAHYADIRLFHISCVALSGALFLSRGSLRIAEMPLANHRALRVTSYVIDSALLTGGILLTMILHQYPFTDAWLTAKVLLLVIYIVFGLCALKGAHRRRMRIMAYLAALATYAFIVGVAFTHRPAGWITLMNR
jgi:uncharacterized membrane protein SirB2